MNILETIAAKTRERTEAEKKQLSLETVRNMAEKKAAAEKKDENGQFTYRFQQALAGEDISFICEVKCDRRRFSISADCQRIRTGRGISHFLPDRTILVPGER